MKVAYAVMVSMQLVLLAVILLGYDEHIHFVEEGFLEISITVGLLVTVAYLIALFKPSIRSLSPLGNFLTDRMYMPFINDYIIPQIGWGIIKVVDSCNRGIDLTVHRAIPSVFDEVSRAIRTIQKGHLRTYMKIVTGFVMVFMVISALVGW